MNDVYVTRFLEAFTSRDCCREIQGNTVISGAQFLNTLKHISKMLILVIIIVIHLQMLLIGHSTNGAKEVKALD